MVDTLSYRLSGWFKAITFDRAITAGIVILLMSCAGSFVIAVSGVEIWVHTDLASGRIVPERIDLLFATLYTAIAVLYVQNILHFYQTRERLYLTYCFYITFMALHVLLYGQALRVFGMNLPLQWDAATALTVHNISMIYMLSFARQLLDSKRAAPKLDLLLRLGMILTLFPTAVVYLAGDTAFYIYDTFLMSVVGGIVLFSSARLAWRGNRAALIFFLSYLAQYVGFFWSYVVFVFPDMAATLNPLYADTPFLAESFIWIAALALEALLMSFAAHLHVREAKSVATEVADRAARLERALNLAKSQLADAARRSKDIASASEATDGSAGKTSDGIASKVKDGTRPKLAFALKEIIETNAAEPFVDVAFLASATAMSKATLLRHLKEETGLSPSAFIRQVRLDLARVKLMSGEVQTISEVMGKCGFSNQGHFTERYLVAFDESPLETLKTA